MNSQEPKVDLSKIEEVKLDNGKTYIKYVDTNTNKPVMLDITDSNKSAQEIIESIQSGSFNFNSNNAIHNTEGILNLENKWTKHNLKIIPVEDIKNYSDEISTEKMPIIDLFQKNKDNFNPPIKYIDIEAGIALDTNNNVIMCKLNKEKNGFDVKYAETTKYEVKKEEQQINTPPTTPGINTDEIVNKLIENQPIIINGKPIDAEFLINYRDQIHRFIPEDQIEIWNEIFKKYDNIKQNQQEQIKDNPPKIYQLKAQPKQPETKQAAFVSNNLTLFIGGFTSGILFALILYYVIKIFF